MKKRFVLFLLTMILALSCHTISFAEDADSEDSDNIFTDIDATTYYYDHFSNDAYRNVYDQLKASADAFHNSDNNAAYTQESEDLIYYVAFTINVSKKNWEVIGDDGMAMVIRAFLADNPTYFWMSKSYKYKVAVSENGSQCFLVSIICYDDYANGKSRQVLVNNTKINIGNYASSVENNNSPYTKEYLVHNALIENTTFASEEETARTADVWAYTVDGVFNSKHKRAISFGYAKAFKAVMDELNIPCIYVEGNTKSDTDSDNVNQTYNSHAWNMVCLDDGWYVVDLAYDDPQTTSGKDVLMYDYFNITSETANDLVPAEDWLTGIPVCNGSKYSLENIQSELKNGSVWQEDNYNFFDKILDTYGLSVVFISIGLILILIVILIKHMHRNNLKKRKAKIKKTKTKLIKDSDINNEITRETLS